MSFLLKGFAEIKEIILAILLERRLITFTYKWTCYNNKSICVTHGKCPSWSWLTIKVSPNNSFCQWPVIQAASRAEPLWSKDKVCSPQPAGNSSEVASSCRVSGWPGEGGDGEGCHQHPGNSGTRRCHYRVTWCHHRHRDQRWGYPGILVEGLGPLFIHIVYYFSGSSSLSLQIENCTVPLVIIKGSVFQQREFWFCSVREWKITLGGGGAGSCSGGTGCVLKQGDAMIG